MEDFNLEEITTKEPDQLTEDEKSFLNDNKDQLGDDVAKKYGIDKTPEPVVPQTRFQDQGNSDDGEDGDIDPDDEKTISKVVDKKISNVTQQLRQQQDQAELNAFIVENPEFSKYKTAIETYMKHPTYNNIPVANIAAIVAHKDLMKLGAQKEREAQKRANDTKNNVNNSSRADTKKGTDWGSASPEAVAQKRAEVLGRPN